MEQVRRIIGIFQIPCNILQPLGQPDHTLICVDQGQVRPLHAAPCHPDRIEGQGPLMSEGSHEAEYQNR